MKPVILSNKKLLMSILLGGLTIALLCSQDRVWSQTRISNGLSSQSSALADQQAQRLMEDKLRSTKETGQGTFKSFSDIDPNDPNTSGQSFEKLEPEPPSSVELLMTGQVPNDVNVASLKQFGYEVFNQKTSQFRPLLNVPVGENYVIGPGDCFTITMWGRHNDQLSVHVGRDGNIALPEVGVLSVAGMSFGDMKDFLESELKRKFTDFRIHTAMGKLRTLTVYVVGEARIPGSYTVSSLSTVINALFAAGGPSKNGSLRDIRLQRTGQAPQVIDLYDFLMGGDKSSDIRLQDGDTIYIPLVKSVVGIAGNVKRPAIYEMKASLSLSQALDLAGGVNYAGMLQHIQVDRIENHRRRIVADFDLTDSSGGLDQTVLDGDLVKVYPVLEREEQVVYLEGHVVRPGKYALKPGMRLSDLLTSNELFKPQINMQYAEIVRMVPPDLNPITLSFNLGRVMQGGSEQDYPLEQFDIVRLFRWNEKGKRSVRVSGMVYEPNEYRFVEGMKLKELIDAAGGLQKNSYLRTAEVTRLHISQDGMQTEKIEVDLAKALQGDSVNNVLLQDYDHLVVRPIPELNFDETVEIVGEVRFPGIYPIRKDERLSSIIERAGGFSDDAYLKGAVFVRESAMEVQQQRMDDLIRQLEESLLTTTSQGLSGAMDADSVDMQKANLESKKELIAKLRTARIEGRVVIKLSSDDFKASKYDLELEDGDILTVPRLPGIINVVGEVFNPTALLYEPGQNVEQYLARVGGMTKDADQKQVSVIRADGSVISMMQKSRQGFAWDSESNQWFFGGSFMTTKLDPGDTIVVPKKLDYNKWLRTTKDLTQIIFQVALAAGVVIAL